MTRGVELGAGEIRLMAVDREGRRTGFDLELHAEARAAINTPIILEGGAGTLEDLTTAMAAGVDSLAQSAPCSSSRTTISSNSSASWPGPASRCGPDRTTMTTLETPQLILTELSAEHRWWSLIWTG